MELDKGPERGLGCRWREDGVTDKQKGYLQALSTMRLWQRWQIGECLGDARAMQAHEQAIAWLDDLIATKKRHAAEDEAERRHDRSAGKT
jgi:hypothetical protein